VTDHRTDPPVPSPTTRSRRAFWVLAALAVLSVLASGLIMAAGGGPAVLLMVRETLAALHERPVLIASLFAAWALVANCLVVPAGTLSMIVGGALLGTALPTLIWSLAQLITAPLLYALTKRGVGTVPMLQTAQVAQLVALAQTNGLQTTALLRLLPIMPNAAATMIAATAGIELRTFFLGSLLTGWVRPAYFAGLGAAVGSLSKVDAVTDLLSLRTLLPLVLLFAGAVVFCTLSCTKNRRSIG
jgi:uncharacterized membrane protein YdjX (TVP38/TMEM64 family)